MRSLLILTGFVLSLTTDAKPTQLVNCSSPLSIKQINEATKTLHDLTLNPRAEYQINQRTFVKDVRDQNLQDFYRSCVQPQISQFELANLTTQEIDTLFEALKRINFYVPRTDITEFLLRIIDRQTRNKQLVINTSIQQRIADIYRALVNLRQFNQAKQLAIRFPRVELPVLPAQVNLSTDTSDKALLKLNQSGQQLNKIKFEPETDNYVVVVSSPNCFASNRFIDWLYQAQNSKLTSQIINGLYFVTPPSDILFAQRLTHINQQYRNLDMQTAFTKKNWSDINYWGTPTMYFYQNGELVRQIIGWPKDKEAQKLKKQELIEALTEIKLLN